MSKKFLAKSSPYFIKSFHNLQQFQVQVLFMHSCEIAKALETIEDKVIFPKPLRHVNCEIYYEFVRLDQPILQLISSYGCTEKILFDIGYILKVLHNVRSDKDGIHLLHGDFVPHNFFITESRLVLIDPHPPENLGFSYERLYGLPLFEVVGFIYCLLSDAGFRQSIFHLKYHIRMTRSFLKGYGAENFKALEFLKPLFLNIRDVFKQKRVANFGLMGSLFHCVFGGLVTLYVIYRAI